MVSLEEEGFVDISFTLHCAVYALVRRGEVVYVGQSKKPLTRLYSHAQGRGKLESWRAGYVKRKVGFAFDSIWLRPCMLAELDTLEESMIKKYQPKHNTKHLPTKPPLDIAEIMNHLAPLMPAATEPKTFIRRRL